MKTVSMSKGATPENYVRELCLRSPVSSQVYLSILNGFQRFVAEKSENESASQTTIRQWLKDRTLAWPFHIVTDRARLVDRFLDWRVNNRALTSNPFADLRAEYGQRTTTPVVRALLNPNPEAALEALRPLPRFGSFLGPVMRESDLVLTHQRGSYARDAAWTMPGCLADGRSRWIHMKRPGAALARPLPQMWRTHQQRSSGP